MKAASIHELQKELAVLEPKKLKELCIRLAKYKKDNKELLSYLLFEAHDEKSYIKNIKEEIDILFKELNRNTVYLTKKIFVKIYGSLTSSSNIRGISKLKLNCESISAQK